jgi:hypothetical protein
MWWTAGMTRQACVQTIPGPFYHHGCIGAAINLFLCGVENHTYQHYGNLQLITGLTMIFGHRDRREGLAFGAPGQLDLLVGQEHGQTIPLAETKPTNLYSFAFGRYLRIMTCSVLLDLDGTLIDSYPGILASCIAALRAL